jgi:aminoglycoside phosphotransferase (APT) family kinase protein
MARSSRAEEPFAVVDDPGPPASRPSARSVPPWLRAAFDGVVIDASPSPWGFRNETWLAELGDGRRFVATRLADRRAAAVVAARIVAVRPRLSAVGLPVPALAAPRLRRARGVLISQFQDGVPGPDLLREPSGPAIVGSLLGSAWRLLALADPAGLGLPDLWATPDRLASAARDWLAELATGLARADRARLAATIEMLPGLVGGRPAGIVHGDLVPANILVGDGVLVALLDLEFVRLGDPRLDAAWFDWIVWFHHRSIHPVAWQAFRRAGGIEPGDAPTHEAIRMLPAIRLLEILHGLERGDPARTRWMEHLDAWLARR